MEELLELEVCAHNFSIHIRTYTHTHQTIHVVRRLRFLTHGSFCVRLCLSVRLQSEWDSFIESVDEGVHAGAGQSSGLRADSLSPEIPLADGGSGK